MHINISICNLTLTVINTNILLLTNILAITKDTAEREREIGFCLYAWGSVLLSCAIYSFHT